MNKLVLWLLILVVVSGCRSRKEAIREAFDEFTSDTTTVVTSDTSVRNINESSHTIQFSDETGERIEFQENGGEIQFHPDGTVTMTGVSAYGIKNRKSETELTSQLSVRDSVFSSAQTESSQKIETIATRQSDLPSSNTKSHLGILYSCISLLIAMSITLLLRKKK